MTDEATNLDATASAANDGAAVESAEAAALEERFKIDLDIEHYLPSEIQPFWEFMQDYPILLVVLLFIAGYLAGKGLQWIVRAILRQAASRTESDFDDKLIHYLSAPIVQTMVILALVGAIKAFGFSDVVDQVLVRFMLSLLLLFWSRAWFKAIHLAIEAMSREGQKFKLFQPRTLPLMEMSFKLFLLSLVIWIFMALWNIDGTAWLASAGVVGIAVGFAAKDTLANLISGVSIIADAPYKIGDYVVLDTGERGVVSKLGMRSTRLQTRDDVEISIPNAVMGNAKIVNESGGPAVEHRIRVPVGVAYSTRPAKVIEILEQVASDNEMILDYPAPRVRMRAFGVNSKDFELMGWIRFPEQRGLVRHHLLLAIDQRFLDEGIEIPFPQRDIHIKGEASLPAETAEETE